MKAQEPGKIESETSEVTPSLPGAGKVISTILRYDRKVTTYKLALIRAINDVALSFPGLGSKGRDVAVPLRMLAEYWVAYYWPFVEIHHPLLQGTRFKRKGGLSRDMDFRESLTALREEWELALGATSGKPSDGFYLINEMRIARRRATYSPALRECYAQTLKAIAKTLQMPIRYAGPRGEEWSVFERPLRLEEVASPVETVPGTRPDDRCLLIKAELWHSFRELSLWVEALCIHEWCLFTEGLTTQSEEEEKVDRGVIYRLLTDRPDNRRPLTWERNQVDLLLLEGHEFSCPWTHKSIRKGITYDLDHLVPVKVYPINELWNLVPSDPYFNSHVKRDRLPSFQRLLKAEPELIRTYTYYDFSQSLKRAMHEDTKLRFIELEGGIKPDKFPARLANSVIRFIYELTQALNLTLFS